MTEEVAIAVLDLYPTVFSLAREYSLLVSPHSLGELENLQLISSGNCHPLMRFQILLWLG